MSVKRCERCILPATTPKICFNQQGICNFCDTFEKPVFKGEKALLDLLESQKKGKKYDCIVTLSGGRDSSYTALKLVKDYGVKVLAVNFDNPFTDPVAKENIDNIVRILGINLIKIQRDNTDFEKVFKSCVLAWFNNPSAALVPLMCSGCHTMFIDFLKIAKMNDISCIISGGNPYEYISFKRELMGVKHTENPNYVYLKGSMGFLREAITHPSYFSPSCLPIIMKGYLFGDEGALGTRLLGLKIKKFQIFDYLEWNEREVISRITNELDWKWPEKLRSSWRFDCKVSHLKDYMYMRTLRMTERDDLYSKLIRCGLMSREEALKRLNEENIIYYDEIENILNQLDIPCSILDHLENK